MSLSENSHKMYNSAWLSYQNMQRELGKPASVPISRDDLVAFIAHLSLSGKKASTICSYVSGLAFLHKSKNFADPSDCFLVRKILEGSRRDKPSTPDFRHPLTLNLLHTAITGTKIICLSDYEATLFEAAMVLAFYAFLRVSEFTALSKNKISDRALQIGDVRFVPAQVHGEGHMHVTIRYSKTDQRGRSTTLIIPEARETDVCPVRALKRYIDMRTPGEGQLFWHFDRSPLTRFQFSSVLKRALEVKGVLNVGFTSHSLRIGACTHFAMLGVDDDELMRMGRWSSSAYQRYIRIPV